MYALYVIMKMVKQPSKNFLQPQIVVKYLKYFFFLFICTSTESGVVGVVLIYHIMLTKYLV